MYGYIYIEREREREREIYCKELAHMIMEAETSKARRTKGIAPV